MVELDSFELTGIKTYTRFWGLLMFGSYCVINVIVLLNLLIAMMSNSYAMIEVSILSNEKLVALLYYFRSTQIQNGNLLEPNCGWAISKKLELFRLRLIYFRSQNTFSNCWEYERRINLTGCLPRYILLLSIKVGLYAGSKTRIYFEIIRDETVKKRNEITDIPQLWEL